MYAYTRSENVDILKHTDEVIKDNYSSEQYMNALDTLFWYAFQPIIKSSDYLDRKVASLLLKQVTHPTRKFSAHRKEQLLEYLSEYLTERDTSKKVNLLKKARLHLNVLVSFISDWLGITKDYPTKYLRQEHEAAEVEALVAHTPDVHDSLFACVRNCRYWFTYALRLRELVLQKYHRLIVNEAVSTYKRLSHSVDLDDLVNMMTAEALKAIDRCDVEKGPITSYLQRNLRFSSQQINFEFDTAYSVHGKRTDFSYKAQDLQEDDLEQSFTEEYETDSDVIRHIARILDPVGAGRYFLGIEEYAKALTP